MHTLLVVLGFWLALTIPVALFLGNWISKGVGVDALRAPAGYLAVASDGTKHGTTVHDSKGRRVLGITGVCFNAEKGRTATCAVDLDSREFFGIGLAQYQVTDPLTGRWRAVRRVVWADGSEWAAEEAGKQ